MPIFSALSRLVDVLPKRALKPILLSQWQKLENIMTREEQEQVPTARTVYPSVAGPSASHTPAD